MFRSENGGKISGGEYAEVRRKDGMRAMGFKWIAEADLKLSVKTLV